jgi:hypothetical protein
VRKLIRWTVAPVAVVALACSKDNPNRPSAMREDLKRDLQLATATQTLKISPDEISPKAHEELAVKPKKAPNGPKVIRSQKPTVKASVTPREVAETKQDLPNVQMVATAPAPSETPAPDAAPPLARPAPVPVQASFPGAQPIPATGSGAGAVLGGIMGAVIRGGMVGDDDHCDPRPGRRRVGGIIGSGSYIPSATPGIGGHLPGGMRPRW